jgi:hypothetical protein|tara:strand:- start:601 stop:1038 length:438 start_codon:yes stop_codon:yes gene_type:complete
MKYQQVCHECGHKIAASTHNINTGMISALEMFIQRYNEVGRAVNINTEIQLSHNQLAGFRKLKHFGLVKKADGNGKWLPTNKGLKFDQELVGIWNPSASFNDETLESDHDAWETHSKAREYLMKSEVKETRYKQRLEYQQEKRGW